MATVYMICQATVGNCVRIGMIVPKDTMFFGAALGVALHTTLPVDRRIIAHRNDAELSGFRCVAGLK